MDAKITKQRLSRFLSYDWLKIIGIAVVFIIAWSLIFSMTATRITPSQQFTVFNHYANVSLNYTPAFYDNYYTAFDRNVFSYEVLELDVIDLSTAGDQVYAMCDTRFATGQGDLIFIPNVTDTETAVTSTDENGETVTTYTHTYVESFFTRYTGYVVDWDDYIEGAQAYLAEYYGEDYANGTLDKDKAERNFRARVEENNDKRFKRESQIRDGVESECERLEKYRNEFVQFEKYLADGVIRLENVSLKDGNGNVMKDENGNIIREGDYALNINPDGKNEKLTETVYYSVQAEDGSQKACADNMCVMVFKLPGMDDDFLCETVLYLNTVIEASLPTQTA